MSKETQKAYADGYKQGRFDERLDTAHCDPMNCPFAKDAEGWVVSSEFLNESQARHDKYHITHPKN